MTSAPTRRRQAKSIAAEAAFRARIAGRGGRVIGEYVNDSTPVDCVCPAGHACKPRPTNIRPGRGMCGPCSGKDPAATEARFRAHVAKQGGQVVGEYRGILTAVDCICAAGHPCRPWPSSLQQGRHMCPRCAARAGTRRRSSGAEQAFRDAVTALGGRVVGGYVSAMTLVECVCREGHTCYPRPSHVQQGVGICFTCGGKDPAVAEAAFRTRVAELGGQVVGEYTDARTSVECICIEDHTCWPTPDHLKQRGNLCRTCSGRDPIVAEAAFRQRILALGGRVVGEYASMQTPIECVCAEGHDCRPTPSNVVRGQGMCPQCAGKTWDVFYVVANPKLRRVKFGITSGDERARLCKHRRDGYTIIIRTLPGLPDAAALERHTLETLRAAGVTAVQGREYFDAGVLGVVLDVVDGWVAA